MQTASAGHCRLYTRSAQHVWRSRCPASALRQAAHSTHLTYKSRVGQRLRLKQVAPAHLAASNGGQRCGPHVQALLRVCWGQRGSEANGGWPAVDVR